MSWGPEPYQILGTYYGSDGLRIVSVDQKHTILVMVLGSGFKYKTQSFEQVELVAHLLIYFNSSANVGIT